MDSLAQCIEEWAVIAGDRLTGRIFNRAGHRDGASLVTSPVIEVRLMGTGHWSETYLVAFTESGHFYRLGRPASSFGTAAAKEFIHAKLTEPMEGARCRASKAASDSQARSVEATLDTNFQNFDTIELYASSFAPT
jgi:hypothetical protein